VSEPSAGSGPEAIVRDYFSRLERALAPLPRDRRQQILDDLRGHVNIALAEGTRVSQVLETLGTPGDIANEAYASEPTRPARRARRPRRLQLRYTMALAAVAVALAGGTVGFAVTSDTASPHPAKSVSELTAHVANANSTCAPLTVAAASGGPASALASSATEVTSGTTSGQAWALWSRKGETGARGIEDGGLVIGGRAYGLCPGYPNPAELELADIGGHGLVYGVIGYPGRAKVWLYKSTAGTFATGAALPAPEVKVVDGVSFFIGALPASACDYPSLELNATSPGFSDEHNLGFGACTAGRLVPIAASQGMWQLPTGHFPKDF
jgi:HAAS